MHQGKIMAILRGLQSAGRGAEQAKITAASFEAQVSRDHGPSSHRDLGVLAHYGDSTTSDSSQDSTEVFRLRARVSPRKRRPGQLGTLAAVHWKGANPPARRAAIWDHGGFSRASARDVRQGRRRLSGSDSHLTWKYAQIESPRRRARQEYSGTPSKTGDPRTRPDHAQGPASSSRASPSWRDDGSTQSGCWISAARGAPPAI